jgi:hypothetical protein
MPSPRGRHHEIARPHDHLLVIDRRVRAVAFHDEAKRRLRVAMLRRELAGHDELQSGEKRVRDLRAAAQPGILEQQHAPLGFLRADVLGRFHEVGTQLRIAPLVGDARGRGLAGHQALQPLPQRRHVERLDALVEILALGFRIPGVHRQSSTFQPYSHSTAS